MKRPFADDEEFCSGLLTLLKNPVAQQIEQSHLNPARNYVVFHFLPDELRKAINNAPNSQCVFASAVGTKTRNVHYGFADVLAAEVLVGIPCEDPEFLSTFTKAAEKTREFVIKFAQDSENLIGNYLKMWGFEKE